MKKKFLCSLLFSGIILTTSNVYVYAYDVVNPTAIDMSFEKADTFDYGAYITTEDVIELNDKIDYIKSHNSEITESELENILKSSLRQKYLFNSNTISTFSYSDLPIVKGMLNSEEKKIFNRSLIKGTKVLKYGLQAKTESENLYKDSFLYNNNGDAFRHAYWNARIACEYGPTYAKEWSDAHENGVANNPPLEKQMDLYNNKIGYTLGDTIPSNCSAAITFKLIPMVEKGQLKRIVNNNLVPTDSSGRR